MAGMGVGILNASFESMRLVLDDSHDGAKN
jgi:hypothetical protein